MTRTLCLAVSILAVTPLTAHADAARDRPLFRDFMGINGNFTFKPELYRPVCRLVRNYHNLNWDVKEPGDPITLPTCINRVNWKSDVYGPWQKAGFETDICIQFGGFQPTAPDYQRFWIGKEQWCHDYGKAMARYFGPSGNEKLCTSMEIGNEPGARFDAALYRSIFTNLAQGIRAGDPKVKILTPAVQSGKGDDYTQDLRGIYADPAVLPLYDVINLHTYAIVQRKDPSQSPWDRSYPEDPAIAYLNVVDEAIKWRDANARDKEVWVTEFGYDACTPEAMKRRTDWSLKLNWQGTTDLQQAQYLVRSFLALAERDVKRAYLYYYDDDDSASIHGSSGLTRKFVPKMSFWAVKQLYEMLGNYRFSRIVKEEPGEVFVDEFERPDNRSRVVWAAWSPTGARTNEKATFTPHSARVRLDHLPGAPEQMVSMATTDAAAESIALERSDPDAVTLTVSESPRYITFRRPP